MFDKCKLFFPFQPWEAADGSVYLLVELANIPDCVEKVSNMLSMMQDAARHRHYTMHFYFLETVAKLLPLLATRLGKRHFKPHLEGFFESIFYSYDRLRMIVYLDVFTILINLFTFTVIMPWPHQQQENVLNHCLNFLGQTF